jgi:DNA topoisomerase-3
LRLKFVRNVKKDPNKGKSAYGCSNYKGCDFVFTLTQKKNRETTYDYSKGSTVNLKDFKTDLGTVDGLLRFDENFKLKLEPKKIATPPKRQSPVESTLS